MFRSLTIKQFTLFDDFRMDFVPGLNVFVGANGTGKTHLLKLLYSFQWAMERGGQDAVPAEVLDKLVRVFRPEDDQLNRLVTRKSPRTMAHLAVTWGDGTQIAASFPNRLTPKPEVRGKVRGDVGVPIYIPVKEPLSMAPGFLSIYDKYKLEIEEVYYDTIKLAYLPQLRGPVGQDRQRLLDDISKIVQGKVIVLGERFYLENKGKIEMTLVAEGMRKLALIWKLIQNGTLGEGTSLFWDEPEANLNPTMMPAVASILTTLQRNGVQIFLATHSYSFLKELEILKGPNDSLCFYSLFRGEGNRLQYNAASTYAGITPNRIQDEYMRLYDIEIERSLGGMNG